MILKLYLDNCCFNRPYDDQTQLRINLETQAKLFIQQQILEGRYELEWSFILEYENAQNPFPDKRNAIAEWKNIAVETILASDDIITYANGLSRKGIKPKDALHIACAVFSKCDYFITTDRKLLNTHLDDLRILDPINFVSEMEE